MNTFVVGDLHFGHTNIIKFKRQDGTPLRDFPTVIDHDEFLVAQWNSVVRHEDLVWVLGDVVMNRKNLPVVEKLQGRKKLVLGNHDNWKYEDLSPYFESLHGAVGGHWGGTHYWMTHIPVHPDCLNRYAYNIHGHLHANEINDGRYFCASVDNIRMNFPPKPLSEIMQEFGLTVEESDDNASHTPT